MNNDFKANIVKAKPGATWVGEQNYPLGKMNAGSAIDYLQRVNADCVLGSPVGPDLVALLREGKARGWLEKVQVHRPSGGLAGMAGHDAADDAPVGWFVSGYPWETFDVPAHKKFVADYQAKYGTHPGYGSLIGYLSGQAIAAGIAQGRLDRHREDDPGLPRRGVRQHHRPDQMASRTISSSLAHFVGTIAIKDGKVGHGRYGLFRHGWTSHRRGRPEAATAPARTTKLGHAHDAFWRRSEFTERAWLAFSVTSSTCSCNGLGIAAGLFIVSSGLSIIFGVSRVYNFAHGSLYMMGAYIAYSILTRLPPGPVWFLTGIIPGGARGRHLRPVHGNDDPAAYLQRAASSPDHRDLRGLPDRPRRDAADVGAGAARGAKRARPFDPRFHFRPAVSQILHADVRRQSGDIHRADPDFP